MKLDTIMLQGVDCLMGSKNLPEVLMDFDGLYVQMWREDEKYLFFTCYRAQIGHLLERSSYWGKSIVSTINNTNSHREERQHRLLSVEEKTCIENDMRRYSISRIFHFLTYIDYARNQTFQGYGFSAIEEIFFPVEGRTHFLNTLEGLSAYENVLRSLDLSDMMNDVSYKNGFDFSTHKIS